MLSGVVPTTGSGVVWVRITATDTYGKSATEKFGIGYAPSGTIVFVFIALSNPTAASVGIAFHS